MRLRLLSTHLLTLGAPDSVPIALRCERVKLSSHLPLRSRDDDAREYSSYGLVCCAVRVRAAVRATGAPLLRAALCVFPLDPHPPLLHLDRARRCRSVSSGLSDVTVRARGCSRGAEAGVRDVWFLALVLRAKRAWRPR